MGSRSKQDLTATHGAGMHDFITSGAGAQADQRYSSFFAWGGSAAVTYEQMKPDGTFVSGSATITQSDPGIYNLAGLKNVAVTDGGTIIAYRKA